MFWICRAPVGRFILRFLLVIFLAIIVLLCVRSYLSLYHHKLDISRPLRRTQHESVHNSNNIKLENGLVPHQNHTILGNHAAIKGSIDERSQSTRRGSVDIVIVDEHHEVLQYWFSFSNNKLNGGEKMRRGKHTVVHFDGHSDFGPISYTPDLPLFRWPETRDDILKLMQRNDVFIMAGVGTGLIRRFIWVWPEWTRADTQPNFGDYTTAKLEMGLFNFTEGDRQIQGMCFCVSEMMTDGKHAKPHFNIEGERCMYAKPEYIPYEGRDATCDIHVQNIQFVYVSETYMLKNAVTVASFDRDESVILDIDEDYFGCEKGSDYLVATGLEFKHIEKIDEYLSEMFCVESVRNEQRLSPALVSILRSNCTSPLDDDCVSTSTSDHAAVQRAACRNMTTNINTQITRLKAYVTQNLNSTQLDAMLRSEFCLETSPNTARIAVYKQHNPITVCIGANGPRSQNSIFFTPTLARVQKDMNNVRAMVSQIQSNIELVTIARSNRDGYVPRQLQTNIEEGLLLTLLQSEIRSNTNVTYDPNLFYLEHAKCAD